MKNEIAVAEVPCGCGAKVFFTLHESVSIKGWSLTARHRGGRLFEHIIYSNTNWDLGAEDESVVVLSTHVLRKLYTSLAGWGALEDSGLHCADYWKTPWEVMKSV